jgi:gliding motility-associated-like protein
MSLLTFRVSSQPPCAANPIAGDFCSTATPICNLNGYCGNTSASYTNWVSSSNHTNETNTPLGSIFCATIQNNSWLKFIASANTAVFDVWVQNCSDNHGIQMQIYSTTDCYNFTAVSNCWNPMTPTNGQITATGLIPGNVYFFMIDGTMGDVCDYVIAANTGVVAPFVSPAQSICKGFTATITASGGSGYNWTSSPADPSLAGQTTNATINVTPTVTTTYSVTITIPGSNLFCPTTSNVLTSVVTVPAVPPYTINATDDHCAHADGTASVQVNGDSTAYTYLWSTTPIPQTTATATGLSYGTYSVTITDSNACVADTSINVLLNPNLDPQISGPSGLCTGDTILLDAGGNYNIYFWSDSSANQTLSVTSGGTYMVYVSDGPNCAGSDTLTISEFTPPTPIISGPDYVCTGNSVTLNAGNGYSSCLWSTGASSPTLTATSGGVYSVSVTDANNCHGSDADTLAEKHPPILSAHSEYEMCHLHNGSAGVAVSGQGSVFHFLWNNGDTTQNIYGLTSGNYAVTVADEYCSSEASTTVGEIPGPTAAFTFHPPVAVIDDANIRFEDLSTGIISHWMWSFGDLAGDTIQNPYHTYQQTGFFNVELKITNQYGCRDSAYKQVAITEQPEIWVPNAFTPNGDGSNEYFMAKGINISDFSMYIYNRWGEQVFYSDDMSKGWDGRYRGNPVEEGVYSWVIFYSENYANIVVQPQMKKGIVMVIY